VFGADLLDVVLSEEANVDPADATTERILDAALAEFRSFGLRRATVEDITRRARVGRMTLHRRFPSKQALIGAVFLREIRRTLADVDAIMARHDAIVDKLTDGLAFGIGAVHDNPLFSRLLETDREAMLPYLTVEAKPLMIAASGYVAQQLTASGRTATDPATTGEAIIRFCHSILLTPEGRLDLRDGDTLRGFIRGPVAAMIAG
jgi:AcrR family transcriptional regulator